MRWGDVKLLKDPEGTEYLQYTERQTKTRTGIDPKNVRKVKTKMFSTLTERNPVAAYKKYSEMRPLSMNTPESPFCLGLNHTGKEDSDKKKVQDSSCGGKQPFFIDENKCQKSKLG
jgi:hypothetical protein